MARRKRTPSVPPVSLTRLRFFEHLFYSAAAGAMIFDLEGRVTHVNPAAERLLGWRSGELAGRSATEFVAPGSESILQRVLESGRSWSGVVPRRRKSGSVFPARGVVSIVRDEFGEPLGLISFFVDDTPNQRRRARLASLTALGAALNAETDLNSLLARIDQEARDLFPDGRFGPEDAEVAQAFAEMAAVAIEDARLHEAERTKNERLLTLARVNQLLAASLEREEVLEAITAGAQRLLGADDVVIWLLQGPDEPFRLAHYVTKSGLVPSRELDRHDSKLGEVLASGRPWQVADLAVEGSLPNARYRFERARSRGAHGCLMVPLVARGRPLGGFAILSEEVRTFDGEEVELAQAFAHQAALAVQNAETLAGERQASRLEQILQRSKSLEPRDRLHVEQLLAAAERVIELSVADQ